MGKNIKSLDINDFAESFGANREELSLFCEELIESLNFSYEICSNEMQNAISKDILNKCNNKAFSISGPHRRKDWAIGWGQIYNEFISTGRDLRSLVPKDIRGDKPLRYKGKYITSNSRSFEYDFSLVFKTWLFRKYLIDYSNIYEFGCGTGHNLALLAQMFPDKNYSGADWVDESQNILNELSNTYDWRIKGHKFDLANPDYNLRLPPNTAAYTFAALEQLGTDHKKFINYLLAQKPGLCVHVECISEYYNESDPFDLVALRYHKSRNYLEGLLTYLKDLEKCEKLQIINTKRLGFGSVNHEIFSYIVWKPL